MTQRTVMFDLPEEIAVLLGTPEAAGAKARQALVIELLRQAEISQGKAAELLGLTRWDMIDLMTEHQIPSGPRTEKERRRELEELRRYSERYRPDAGRQ